MTQSGGGGGGGLKTLTSGGPWGSQDKTKQVVQ